MEPIDPSISERTAKLRADLTGLWDRGQRMTRPVTGYLLLQELNSQGLCMPEIEALVETRRNQREKIVGKALVKDCKVKEMENNKHRRKQMEIGVDEAKRDWKESRSDYRSWKLGICNWVRNK